MAEKRLYWLKLKDDFFSAKAMKKLRRMAGGDTYTIIYLKMLLLSLREQGRIYYDGVEDTMPEEVALELDEDPDNVRFCMLFLENNGLLEKVSEFEAFLTEMPSMTLSESASAGRVRRHRAQKTLQCNAQPLHCNSDVTARNKNVTTDIDKDTDTDINTEIDMMAQSCKTTPAPEPQVYVLPCIKNETYGITQSQIDLWADVYPNVDIDLAIKRMIAWLDANPRKRKTVQGCLRFVNTWLGREQDSGKTPRKETEHGDDKSSPSVWDYNTL